VDRVIETLRGSSVAALTIPTAEVGPPLDADEELADEAVKFVQRLLSSEVKLAIDGRPRDLQRADIGLVSTHRSMNATIKRFLDENNVERIVNSDCAPFRTRSNYDASARWQIMRTRNPGDSLS
jgi:hypothetical protein